MQLPSQHQIADQVWVTFGEQILKGTIMSVHFYIGKVKYDIELALGVPVSPDDSTEDSTRIYNIDSVYVHPMDK